MTAEPSAGEHVGAWRLGELLGRGAFGATWRASDSLGRIAAVKLLTVPPGDELRALAGLSHPAIPALLDAQGAPQPYVAMELAQGRPLSHMLRRGRAPEAAALQLVAVLADAMAQVHDAGLCHGDVKPENILVDHIGELRIWLVDFGAVGQPSAGTLHYASPERMRGGDASPAADVYALGLVLWEVVHGALPWFEEGISSALTRRAVEAPQSSLCTPWVAELLEQMLAPEPELRPGAAIVADTLEARGMRLPQPDGASLLRRASTVHVARRAVDARIASWARDGGALSVVGSRGTGRSHSVRRAEVELRASGKPFLKLEHSRFPWQAARRALESAVLTGPPAELPDEPDNAMRARLVARLLAERATGPLWILVDDLERHPPETAALLEAIVAQDGLHLLVAGDRPPSWADRPAVLGELSEAQAGDLAAQLLGGGGIEDAVLPRIFEGIGGLPGSWIRTLAALCDANVLVRRARRWLVDLPRLDDHLAQQQGGTEVTALELPEHERIVAGLLAVAESELSGELLARLVAPYLDETQRRQALEALLHRGLIVAEGQSLRLSNPDLRAPVLAGIEGKEPCMHGALARELAAEECRVVPLLQLAHHVVASEDPELVAEQGPALLRSGMRQDPQLTARLAVGMWAIAPVVELAGPVVEALSSAGRVDEARALGDDCLEGGEERLSVDLLRALARMRIHVDDEPEEGLALLRRAKALLRSKGASTRVGLSLRLLEAQAHFGAGRFPAAEAVARAGCAMDPGTCEEAQDTWITLHGTWAQSVHKIGDVDAAIKILDEVPADIARGRSSRALLVAMRGRLLWHAGRVREAADDLEASADPNSGLPALQRARILNNAGLASYQCGDRRAALQRWEAALLLCERLGARGEVIRLNINLCVAYTEAGRWQRASTAGQAAHDAAAEAGRHDLTAMAAGNMGDLCLHRGDLEGAEDWYQRCSDLALAHGLQGERVELARRMAELAVRRGDSDAAMLAREARSLAETEGDAVEAALARMLLLLCTARGGNAEADELEAAVESILAEFKAKGLGGHLAVARALAAEVALELDKPAEALKIVDAVAMYAVEVGHVPLRRRAEELRKTARERVQRDPRAGRFERMLKLATTVAREQDPDRLLDAVAGAGLELMDGDRCFVLLMQDGEAKVERVRTAREARLSPGPQLPSRSVIDQVIAQQRPVIANDIHERGDLREARSVAALALRAAMCVPMQDGPDLLGLIYVDSQRQSERQLSEATHLMHALASHAAVALSHARHMAEISLRAREAAEVAHDIRSPLASVVSLVQEIQDEQEDFSEEADPRMGEMLGLLRRAIGMAEVLLDGRRAAPEPFFLDAALEGLCQSMDRRAQVQGIRVQTELEAEVRVDAIEGELVRVVGNLINNALKFSPRGGTIHVVLRSMEAGASGVGRDLEITVRDEGPGVPAELLPRLFERGVKSADERGGHGLGLAIVQRLVREAGGSVAVANDTRGGACFTVRLPASLRVAPRATG